MMNGKQMRNRLAVVAKSSGLRSKPGAMSPVSVGEKPSAQGEGGDQVAHEAEHPRDQGGSANRGGAAGDVAGFGVHWRGP